MQTIVPRITRILREAGFELVRDNKHEIYKKGDKTVTIGRNLRDVHLGNRMLKQAGIGLRL